MISERAHVPITGFDVSDQSPTFGVSEAARARYCPGGVCLCETLGQKKKKRSHLKFFSAATFYANVDFFYKFQV